MTRLIGGPHDGANTAYELPTITLAQVAEPSAIWVSPATAMISYSTYILERLHVGDQTLYFYRYEKLSVYDALSHLLRHYSAPQR